MAIGNGGLDGDACIHCEDMKYGSSTGFATVGTNNGHDGSGAPFAVLLQEPRDARPAEKKASKKRNRSPHDSDGILARAPALSFNALT